MNEMFKKTNDIPRKLNPILWFLFAIVIPIIITTVIAAVIMTLAGVKVGDWAKNTAQKIPIVSTFIPAEEEKNYQKEIEKSKKLIANRDEEIESLQNKIEDLEQLNEQLEQDVLKVENKRRSEENIANEEKEENEPDDQLKQLAASFKKMNQKQAALIFQDLNNDIAISVLAQVPNEVRGGILEAMDPKRAAELAELFLK